MVDILKIAVSQQPFDGFRWNFGCKKIGHSDLISH